MNKCGTFDAFSGLILSMIGIPFLFYFDNHSTALSTFSILLFCFGLLFVYSSSSIYHYVQTLSSKDISGA